MKWLVIVGLVLVLLGAAGLVVGYISYEDEHEAEIFGAKISVTETDKRRIPPIVSGTVLGLGAALAVVGALKTKRAGAS